MINEWLTTSALLVILCANFVRLDCNVVSKKDWDGLTPIRVEYLPRPVDLVIVQHTGTRGCSTDSVCEQLMRSIQTYHMDTLKYWDVASSFMIGGNGKVYEGAGWLHVGAHTYGYNKKSIGISLMGNFNDENPTPEALAALKALLKCGVDRGHLKSTYSLVGHRQLIATESPGRKLYNEIRSWPEWLEDTSSIKK